MTRNFRDTNIPERRTVVVYLTRIGPGVCLMACRIIDEHHYYPFFLKKVKTIFANRIIILMTTFLVIDDFKTKTMLLLRDMLLHPVLIYVFIVWVYL